MVASALRLEMLWAISSSLLVAIVSSTLRFQVEIDPAPDSVVTALNEVLQNYRHTRMLMTFSCLLISPTAPMLTFINAGHPYPYLHRYDMGTWVALESDSLPLGTHLQVQPMPIQVEWKHGDSLFIYSDGLIEMQNENGEPYGFNSLERFLYQHVSLSPNEMVAALYRGTGQTTVTVNPWKMT